MEPQLQTLRRDFQVLFLAPLQSKTFLSRKNKGIYRRVHAIPEIGKSVNASCGKFEYKPLQQDLRSFLIVI